MDSLWWYAVGTLISEDLALAAAGVAVGRGEVGWLPATLACAAGIVLGDVLLFLAGRWSAGWWRPAGLEKATAWLEERGLMVVFLSRFTPGLRLPTYFAAGMLRTNFLRFLTYFVAAAAVWTPLFIAGTGYLGMQGVPWWAIGLLAYAGVRGWSARARWRWEFWPAWLVYLPLAPYFVYLALKHRSATVFTAANPGIVGGGLKGESKSAILGALPAWCVAAYRVGGLPETYPAVMKPDVGERGNGVAIVRSEAEARAYRAAGRVIVQEYVPGDEVGVFYYRYPGEVRGRIYSMHRKVFPEVTGDGVRRLGELLRGDPRAGLYEVDRERVPAAGERVRLVEIGAHCRGTQFLDARQWWTRELAETIDEISRAVPGFYFGRYDIRYSSLEELQQGRGFRVIELNGVAAEAGHIYDPAVSLREAYRSLAWQWRVAFEIGAANRARGVRPMPWTELLGLLVDFGPGVAQLDRAVEDGAAGR